LTGLGTIGQITENFLQYFKDISLLPSANPNAIIVNGQKNLPADSIALPGSEVFPIFFKGTTIEDVGVEG